MFHVMLKEEAEMFSNTFTVGPSTVFTSAGVRVAESMKSIWFVFSAALRVAASVMTLIRYLLNQMFFASM